MKYRIEDEDYYVTLKSSTYVYQFVLKARFDELFVGILCKLWTIEPLQLSTSKALATTCVRIVVCSDLRLPSCVGLGSLIDS